MYSSGSQDYVCIPDTYMQQQTRWNEVPHSSYSSQIHYGQSQFMGSTYSNGTGCLQMPPSNGSYDNTSMAPPPQFNDTAESLQRDFDQYMRDTAGSRAPLPSATHHSAQVTPTYRQHPYATIHPNKLYGVGHTHTQDSRGGKQAILPVSGRGTESSTSITRSHSSVSRLYAKTGPAAHPTGSRTSRKDDVVKKDIIALPAQLAQVMGPGPLAPTGYLVVPQRIFYCGPTTYPPIEFMPWRWNTLGNEAIQRLSATYHHIENPHDKVLSHAQEIKIMIQWPGYPHFPFEKRIGTKEGRITREELVELVCKAVVEFVQKLKDGDARVKKEHAEWRIGKNSGLKANKFFVARLLHRGGKYFQPEIWCRDEKAFKAEGVHMYQ